MNRYGVKIYPGLLLFLIALSACSPPKPEKPSEPIAASQAPEPTRIALPDGRGGGVIVFASDRAGGRMDLYLVNADGSQLTQITSTREDELSPVWSPDGTRIAYLAESSSRLGLMVLEIDLLFESGDFLPVRVSEFDAVESPPTWTPDSQSLIYAARIGGSTELIFASLENALNYQLTDEDANVKHPALAPDGTRLVYSSDSAGDFDLYLIEGFNADSGLNSAPTQLTSLAGDELFPTWSPDGQRLVYTSTEQGNKDLVLMAWNGDNPEPLLSSSADEWNACWNSEGNLLTYSYFNFDASLNDLQILDLDTRETFLVTSDPHDNWWPCWKP